MALISKVRTGTDTERFVAPADFVEHLSAIKVWFNVDGAVPVAVRDSIGVSSVVRNLGGRYEIFFSTPFTDTNYCVTGLCDQASQPSNNDNYVSIEALSTGSVELNCLNNTGSFEDADILCGMIAARL